MSGFDFQGEIADGDHQMVEGAAKVDPDKEISGLALDALAVRRGFGRRHRVRCCAARDRRLRRWIQ